MSQDTQNKPIITKDQATEISKGVMAYVKEFFKDPVAASENAYQNSFITVAGLAAFNAALAIVVSILSNVIRALKGYSTLKLGGYIMMILENIAWWVAVPCAFAGLVWFVAKNIEKKEVSFMNALSLCSIPSIPLAAFTLIRLLNVILSHSFFYTIFYTCRAGIGAAMVYLTGIAVLKLLGKSGKNVYSFAIIAAGLYFVDWLITSVIF